jgi:hypothetical protein
VLEVVGNGHPRWMTVTAVAGNGAAGQNPAYSPARPPPQHAADQHFQDPEVSRGGSIGSSVADGLAMKGPR